MNCDDSLGCHMWVTVLKDPVEFCFNRPDVWEKIKFIKTDCDYLLNNQAYFAAPLVPARDIVLLEAKMHPPKKGLASAEGQARLLHDLASIELQAMELGVRTLAEFPEAPVAFREQLAAITVNESEHLQMCLENIDALGFKWGDFPVHTHLWNATSVEDPLLDRILIVHRYLEGSGLDAGDTFLRRLESVSAPYLRSAVETINRDEVGHVEFGSRWFFEVCKTEKKDAGVEFYSRMQALLERIPKRVENVHRELRAKAGFTEAEILALEELRRWFLIPKHEREAPPNLKQFFI